MIYILYVTIILNITKGELGLKKNILIPLLTFLLMFSTLSTSSASEGTLSSSEKVDLSKMRETEASSILFDPQTDEYYDLYSDGYIGEIYEIRDGEIKREVDVEEYIKLREEEEKISLNSTDIVSFEQLQQNITPNYIANYYHFSESSNRERTIFGERASRIHYNPGPGSDTFSLTYSYSQGHSFNVSLGTAEKSAVIAGVGYTWHSSASASGTHSMTIPEGYHGYWRFDPIVRVSTGTLYTYSQWGQLINSRSVRVQYPVKIGNMLDGMLVSVKYK